MAKERTDRLRRRPKSIRYFYMAVTPKSIHTGLSYGGLLYVVKNHGVTALFLADLSSGVVAQVDEPVEAFMEKWREHYNDPEWTYGGVK